MKDAAEGEFSSPTAFPTSSSVQIRFALVIVEIRAVHFQGIRLHWKMVVSVIGERGVFESVASVVIENSFAFTLGSSIAAGESAVLAMDAVDK